ncbi:hypothetical protein [Dyadobacter psychrotolerans]|uniref:Uncharacterized protein n=1 Tax=Dyadobacter psychrotolerans TaxID=2541721 RepID=A0A4R5DUJ1_9BACT|nr:hypothetical protein [Dyadobacter psychrotolerans]TDE18206.1 hypothetical protein E0F88_01285 [Dyadobacter psychrotolerans]
MIRERGEPAIADTSKPILEAPVVPDFPENTQPKRQPANDPDLLRNSKEESDEEDEDDDDVD